MERFTKAVRLDIANQNWYGALVTALTLPDICGWLEDPNRNVGERYKQWWETYLQDEYTSEKDSQGQHIFLSGADCYALRCSYLHQGGDNIKKKHARKQQNAHEVLEQFQFVVPPQNGNYIHCNQHDKVLQLQVDVFCEDICFGVERWVDKIANKRPVVQKRQKTLLTIYSIQGEVLF